MATDTIKEFLVKLGFKIDEAGQKKFIEGVASATKAVTELGLKTVGVAALMTEAVNKISEQYEELYFTAVRTGASATALSTFAFGSKAIGISAGEAAGLSTVTIDNVGHNDAGKEIGGEDLTEILHEYEKFVKGEISGS